LKIIEREAVRAIIVENKQILLVQSNKGDYKFPGGGLDDKESQKECLKLEVREETGYLHCLVKSKVGTVVERKTDEFEENALFEMTSHYYVCELATKEKEGQQLNEYEAILDFTPKWVTIDDAIIQNETLIAKFEQNGWLKRETLVLKQLKTSSLFVNKQ
jgi:8-oxo-dGTP pyrophosphatase MutT (NUDIX family)